MALSKTARIEGGKRLRAFIKALPDNARDELYQAIKSSLVPVHREISAAAPRRTGRLASRIKISVSKRSLRGRVWIRDRIEVRAGSGIYKNRARLIEFGTNPLRFGRRARGPHPLKPQPFVFPVWRRRREVSKQTVIRAIQRAAARSIRR